MITFDYYYTVVNNNNKNAKLPLISLLLKFHGSDPDSGTDPECFNRLDPDPQYCISAKYNNLRPFLLKSSLPRCLPRKRRVRF